MFPILPTQLGIKRLLGRVTSHELNAIGPFADLFRSPCPPLRTSENLNRKVPTSYPHLQAPAILHRSSASKSTVHPDGRRLVCLVCVQKNLRLLLHPPF